MYRAIHIMLIGIAVMIVMLLAAQYLPQIVVGHEPLELRQGAVFRPPIVLPIPAMVVWVLAIAVGSWRVSRLVGWIKQATD